ncbi:MAG: thiamine pyrophosphate-dependent enzyme [Rhodospirillales bacterium]|nr:thiamine pyrophosphate-dependent enzyme [Rhodospirillales bacterium]
MAGGKITLNRRKVVTKILAERGAALVITGLGAPTWDVASVGDDVANFYLWGGMGGAVLIGLGLAVAQPKQPVLVITGDGEMLMGLGGLATIGVQQPANLSIVVLDNQRYGETGMQETHTQHGVDLATVAAGAGFGDAGTVYTEKELAALIARLYRGKGPLFAAIKVKSRDEPMVLPPRDGPFIKHRFRQVVTGEPT